MPDMSVASTTATQEEIDHAVSADWRKPIPSKEPAQPAEAEVEQETEVPVTSEEVETAPASEPEPMQEEDQRPKGKGGFQKKIDKLTKEKSEALSAKALLERELADFKDRFTEIEARLAGKPAGTPDEKAKPEFLTRPMPLESEIGTKYKDWNEYILDLVDWKSDEKLAKRDQLAQQNETQEIQESRQENYREAAKEFADQHPDFNEAIANATKAGMKLPEPIIDLIQELPNGPEVTYYLVTNPDEALELIGMSPAMGFAAIGRISQGLEQESKPAPKVPPAKKIVSTAPAPVKPVAGHSARSASSPEDLSKSDPEAYIRRRVAEIQERRNARRY